MKDNYYTVMNNNECVIILKNFKSPITPYYKKLIGLSNEYDIEANLDFYLRFYFPKQQITTPEERPNKIIIMLNGLNEIYIKHFNLYDRLGESFARLGITSILFPTPFHLNRAAVKKESLKIFGKYEAVPQTLEHFQNPILQLVKNPFYMYMNFIQLLHEYRILRNLINGNFEKITPTDCYTIGPPTKIDKEFYQGHIVNKGKKIEVSLLGYSLGGLKALACFSDNTNAVKSCILINSGATLDKMKLKGLLKDKDEGKWLKAVQVLMHEKNWENYPFADIARADSHFAYIKQIFFKDPLFDPDVVEQVAKKLFLVIGGKDKIVPPESIKRLEPKEYGLNILQIADLGHILVDDPIFNRWYPRIIQILSDFIQELEHRPLSKEEAKTILLALHGICNCNLFDLDKGEASETYMKKRKKVEEKLKICSDVNDRNEALRVFDEARHIAFAFFESIIDFENEIKKLRDKKKLRFDQILYSAYPFLEKRLNEFEKLINENHNGTKVGIILVENNNIYSAMRDNVLQVQLMKYKNILKEVSWGKEKLEPVFDLINKTSFGEI